MSNSPSSATSTSEPDGPMKRSRGLEPDREMETYPSPQDVHSLGSLKPEVSRMGDSMERADRYREAAKMMEREGGARVEDSTIALSVESNGKGGRAPDVQIRFSRCEATPKGVIFEIHIPNARTVELAGDFNDWTPEPMSPDASFPTRWRSTKQLPAGEHRYQFVINGRWISDPHNPVQKPNPFGGRDSIIRSDSDSPVIR